MTTVNDQNAHDIYQRARNLACAEFDVVQAEAQKLAERLRFLRWTIVGLNGLLGEDTDEAYQFPVRMDKSPTWRRNNK